MNAADGSAPLDSRRSLLDFGLRVAGPRDFMINLVLNFVIPLAICWRAEVVPLTGGFSIAVMWGIMVWLVGAIATFFGVFNGMIQRKMGQAGQPLAADAPWLIYALLVATITCWTCLAVFSLTFRWALQFTEATAVAVWIAVVGQSLIAACLGFCVQVLGVLTAAGLKPRRDRIAAAVRTTSDVS